jgi:hypothetical protein
LEEPEIDGRITSKSDEHWNEFVVEEEGGRGREKNRVCFGRVFLVFLSAFIVCICA